MDEFSSGSDQEMQSEDSKLSPLIDKLPFVGIVKEKSPEMNRSPDMNRSHGQSAGLIVKETESGYTGVPENQPTFFSDLPMNIKKEPEDFTFESGSGPIERPEADDLISTHVKTEEIEENIQDATSSVLDSQASSHDAICEQEAQLDPITSDILVESKQEQTEKLNVGNLGQMMETSEEPEHPSTLGGADEKITGASGTTLDCDEEPIAGPSGSKVDCLEVSPVECDGDGKVDGTTEALACSSGTGCVGADEQMVCSTGSKLDGTEELVVTGAEGLVVTGTEGLVVTGTEGLMATGTEGLVVTGAEGLVTTGTEGLVVTGAEGLVAGTDLECAPDARTDARTIGDLDEATFASEDNPSKGTPDDDQREVKVEEESSPAAAAAVVADAESITQERLLQKKVVPDDVISETENQQSKLISSSSDQCVDESVTDDIEMKNTDRNIESEGEPQS